MAQKVSIIIPAYDEENTIDTVLYNVNSVPLPGGLEREIVVINDCSRDNTSQIVQKFIANYPESDIKFYEHESNQGKGAAMRTGFKHATGDFIIVQDADLEYDPRDYNALLQPILEDKADVIYGSRFIGGSSHRVLLFWHSVGNKLLTFVSNMFTNLNLTDIETGYKLFRSDIIQSINLVENRFGFEPEVTAKIARIPNIRIYEVGISYYGRTYSEGKKIHWQDGVRTIYCILKFNLFR